MHLQIYSVKVPLLQRSFLSNMRRFSNVKTKTVYTSTDILIHIEAFTSIVNIMIMIHTTLLQSIVAEFHHLYEHSIIALHHHCSVFLTICICIQIPFQIQWYHAQHSNVDIQCNIVYNVLISSTRTNSFDYTCIVFNVTFI